MGTNFQALLWGADKRQLTAAAQEAFEEVDRLERQMSRFQPTSAISWINARAAYEPVTVEPGLFRLLVQARSISEATDGAFDITAGALVRCWGSFREDAVPPSAEAVSAALTSVGWRHVELREADRTIRFDTPGVALDLGAIGKGYALDRAADILRQQGITSGLLHGGRSTIYALGTAPDGEAWRVGLRHPRDAERRLGVVCLRDEAFSTSAAYEKFFRAGGRVYGHLLDPRSGYPAEGLLSASARCSSATASDALSTAFFVLGVEQTKRYCAAHPHVEALVVPECEAGEEVQLLRLGLHG